MISLARTELSEEEDDAPLGPAARSAPLRSEPVGPLKAVVGFCAAAPEEGCRTGGGGGVYGVAGFGVPASRVNDGGGGGGAFCAAICDGNCGGGGICDELTVVEALLSFLPHSSQYSDPSRLSVPQ